MTPRGSRRSARIITPNQPLKIAPYTLWNGDCQVLLANISKRIQFDLILTSPPYNLGKEYEKKRSSFQKYLRFQADVIEDLVPRLKPSGSICWQVGNYVENGHIEPLDLSLHSLFKEHGLQLRNRIIWRFGHGLHCKRRFSGRYEVVLWYTKTDDYVFNLDEVRIPSKYPGKRTAAGRYTGHPSGKKNPEDVWDIPNVVGNHREKTIHPCQFPVGLAERLILALTSENAHILDPFCGVGSTGVASAVHNRQFVGADTSTEYLVIAKGRIDAALRGFPDYRPHDTPIYDHRQSRLSIPPIRET